jgi:hypothetical protein
VLLRSRHVDLGTGRRGMGLFIQPVSFLEFRIC